MQKLNKLNENELSELLSLLVSIDMEIDKYKHVSNYLPPIIQTKLTSLYETILKEIRIREDN